MVASAIDSPSCGMMIGTCGISLLLQQYASFGCDVFRIGSMRAPQVWMIWNRSVFRVETLRRCIEQMKRLARDARDYFRGRAAPRKRFADAEQTSGARDGRQHGIGVERFNRSQIDNFNLETLTREFLRRRKRFLHHCAVAHDGEIASLPRNARPTGRQPLFR